MRHPEAISEYKILNDKNSIFKERSLSEDFLFVSTFECPQDLFNNLSRKIVNQRLSWITPLNRGSSRELFVGSLQDDAEEYKLILKKCKYSNSYGHNDSFSSNTAFNEIKTNRILHNIISNLTSIPVPSKFSSVEIKVEKPLGIIVDMKEKTKYTVFEFERGFDTGDLLNVHAPLEGERDYDFKTWGIFCSIKDIVDFVEGIARQNGLELNDYSTDQVLYNLETTEQKLNLILLDSERFRIVLRPTF
jgi:hypothetical protein